MLLDDFFEYLETHGGVDDLIVFIEFKMNCEKQYHSTIDVLYICYDCEPHFELLNDCYYCKADEIRVVGFTPLYCVNKTFEYTKDNDNFEIKKEGKNE